MAALESRSYRGSDRIDHDYFANSLAPVVGDAWHRPWARPIVSFAATMPNSHWHAAITYFGAGHGEHLALLRTRLEHMRAQLADMRERLAATHMPGGLDVQRGSILADRVTGSAGAVGSPAMTAILRLSDQAPALPVPSWSHADATPPAGTVQGTDTAIQPHTLAAAPDLQQPDGGPAVHEAQASAPAELAEQQARIAEWGSYWRSASTAMPCGSCTGRACGVCSIRTGAPPRSGGVPSGYAPRILLHYDPTATGEQSPGGPGIAPSPGITLMDTTGSDNPEEAGALLQAATASNTIVLENQKQGTPESEWLIGLGDPTIEGYAAQFSVNRGETVDFKINTDSRHYRIDIYRLGYYGGNGARLVHSIERNLATAQVQPLPLFDPETRLVDAGNWAVSASWDMPDDAVSGVYYAKLTRFDGSGGDNMMTFIVRDDDNPSDITFQTSDTTWQAYNWWGGYNFYGGIDDGGKAGRAYKVSYNRPIITRDGGFAAGPQDFIFGVEYAAIRWLERNGYDVNYITGIDTARDGAQLLNSKVLLSVGHDEYWSADQRDNVEAARDGGVNLAFLSGNEMYWETRWETSIDGTGTPYKTLVSYKERWANDNIDVEGTTSTWRDPHLGSGEPENALTGTMFTVDAYRLDTIEIPYDLSNFRFWTNTAVDDIQPGQVYALTPNLLGYEWDSDVDNGFRPDGLINLSSTTLEVDTLLLDYGNTVGAGTATHALTLYRAPSGALVFSAGSVYWVWGLDENHDLEQTPADVNVQQAMVNLFADMGVQPATLMASLEVAQQTTDTQAPVSTITNPVGSGSYTAAQPITITGTASDPGGGLVAVVEVSTDGGQRWHRATGFENWSYTWIPLAGGTYTLKTRAVDDSVNLEVPGAGVTIAVDPAPTVSFFSTADTPAVTTDNDTAYVNLGVRFSASQDGTIIGLRYYKGLADGGTHVGAIWSATGTLLASATFTGESASGWQTVTFDNPVSIQAGQTYTASYNSQGRYANTPNYFSSAYSVGPLTVHAGNGYYTYGRGTIFPQEASGGTNYWVDVIFSPTVTENLPPSGTNDDGYVLGNDAPYVFTAATLLANDSDPNGDILSITGVGAATGGTVSLNTSNNTITFTPTPGHTGPARFGYAIADGRGGVGSAFVNMTIVDPPSGTGLFTASDSQAAVASGDPTPVSLGVRFIAAVDGSINGIKFYKGVNDVGLHTGSLWTSTGTLLGTLTFSNETASGWQVATFANPVAITAGTSYVASYKSNGNYMVTPGYFAEPHVRGPLTADTANGLFTYGTGNPLPTSTFGASNYWVDVLFEPSGTVNLPPTAVDDGTLTTLQSTALSISAASLLANDTDPEDDPLTLVGVGGAVNGSVTFDAGTNTLTFTPSPGYTGAASFTYTIRDANANTDSATVRVNVNEAPNQGPVGVDDANIASWVDTPLSLTTATLLANDTDANGDKLVITAVGAATHGTVALDSQAGVVTFTPVAGYAGPAGFTYEIADGRGGTASAAVSLAIMAPPQGYGLFAADATPTLVAANDAAPVEVGMRFTTSQSGTINGIRFYKGPQNVGLHTGRVWTSTGTLLGTLTFTNETASGWQTGAFAEPISVTAGSSYVVSYHTNGFYAADGGYFANPVRSGALSAHSNADGGNGVFRYGPGGVMPTNAYNATNYWVDVIFDPGPNLAPTAVADTGISGYENTPLQLAAASLLVNDTDPNGDPLAIASVGAAQNGTVAFDAVSNIVTFTPVSGYVGPAGFTYEVSDGRGGTSTASVDLSILAPPQGHGLFSPDAAPATATVNDPNPVELGMKFSPSTDGIVTGVRFYKGPQNVGPHTGSVWTSTGELLATATFTNESAGGWQTASFTTPVAVTAGSTYVVSYHSNGFYSADAGYFTSSITNGPLTAPSSATSGGNGLYGYGAASAFPTSSFNASNYWVDVIFSGQLAA